MKMSRIYLFSTLLLVVVFSLTGCNSVYNTYSGPPKISASSASTITLNQKIPVEPGKTRVFIQDGRLVDKIDHYKTNCNIEIRKRDDDNWQYIEASQYKITGSQPTEERVVQHQAFKPELLAFNSAYANSNLFLASAMDDGGPSDIYLGIHYYLSGNDNNVMRLSCRSTYDSPDRAKYPTREEIIDTLGEVVTVAF